MMLLTGDEDECDEDSAEEVQSGENNAPSFLQFLRSGVANRTSTPTQQFFTTVPQPAQQLRQRHTHYSSFSDEPEPKREFEFEAEAELESEVEVEVESSLPNPTSCTGANELISIEDTTSSAQALETSKAALEQARTEEPGKRNHPRRDTGVEDYAASLRGGNIVRLLRRITKGCLLGLALLLMFALVAGVGSLWFGSRLAVQTPDNVASRRFPLAKFRTFKDLREAIAENSWVSQPTYRLGGSALLEVQANWTRLWRLDSVVCDTPAQRRDVLWDRDPVCTNITTLGRALEVHAVAHGLAASAMLSGQGSAPLPRVCVCARRRDLAAQTPNTAVYTQSENAAAAISTTTAAAAAASTSASTMTQSFFQFLIVATASDRVQLLDHLHYVEQQPPARQVPRWILVRYYPNSTLRGAITREFRDSATVNCLSRCEELMPVPATEPESNLNSEQ